LLVTVLLGFAYFQWSTFEAVAATRMSIAEIKTKLEARSSLEERMMKHIMEDK
jgi:hypothetical protein